MSRRIDIELTSTRDDGSWTWRAAGAREPKGTLDGALLPEGSSVGDVLRAEVEGYLEGIEIVAVMPAKAPRREPERIQLLAPSRPDESNLVTTQLAGRRGGGRGRDRGDRDDRDRGRGRDGDGRGRGRERGERGERREGGSHRREGGDRDRHERRERPAAPAVEAKPKPKRLRPGRAHRAALLEAVSPEQRPILEQLLQGGIPAVRQAIDKQNEELKAKGEPEVKRDALLKVAEDLRSRAAAAVWRDRAEAAVANVDELDLRDLRSVVNAAGDAGRDDDARALATNLREALVNRVEKEQSAWLAELTDMLREGRTVRALRLSSRPPKAGAIIPADLSNQLVEQANAALTEDTGQERWATVLDALAYSPIRRRVIPTSLPAKLSPQLREVIAKLGSRLPEIAHIFAIEPDEAAGRAATRGGPRRRGAGGAGGGGREGGGRGERQGRGGRKGNEGRGPKGGRPEGGGSGPREAKAGDKSTPATDAPDAPASDAPDAPVGEAPTGDATSTETAPTQASTAESTTEAPTAEATTPDAPTGEAAGTESAPAEAAAPEPAPAEAPSGESDASSGPLAPSAEAEGQGADAAPVAEGPTTDAPSAPEADAPAEAEAAGEAPSAESGPPSEVPATPAPTGDEAAQVDAAAGEATPAEPDTGTVDQDDIGAPTTGTTEDTTAEGTSASPVAEGGSEPSGEAPDSSGSSPVIEVGTMPEDAKDD